MSFQENSIDFLKSYLKRETEINLALNDIHNFKFVYWKARLEHIEAVTRMARKCFEMKDQLYQKVYPLLSAGYDMEAQIPIPGMCLHMMIRIKKKLDGMIKLLLKCREKFRPAYTFALQNPVSPSSTITREDLAKMVIEDRMKLVKSWEEKAKSASNWEALLKDQLGGLDWEKAKADMDAQIEECVELFNIMCDTMKYYTKKLHGSRSLL